MAARWRQRLARLRGDVAGRVDYPEDAGALPINGVLRRCACAADVEYRAGDRTGGFLRQRGLITGEPQRYVEMILSAGQGTREMGRNGGGFGTCHDCTDGQFDAGTRGGRGIL